MGRAEGFATERPRHRRGRFSLTRRSACAAMPASDRRPRGLGLRAPGAHRLGARRRLRRTDRARPARLPGQVPQDGRGRRSPSTAAARRCSTPTSCRLDDPWVDDATSRVWIQGDLHAENYGTYMDSAGVLVFDVNDFDEAYLGHYTWDLQRMAASLALLGFRKALSDKSIAQADRDLRARLRGHRAGVHDLRQRRPRLPADAGLDRWQRRCTTCSWSRGWRRAWRCWTG